MSLTDEYKKEKKPKERISISPPWHHWTTSPSHRVMQEYAHYLSQAGEIMSSLTRSASEEDLLFMKTLTNIHQSNLVSYMRYRKQMTRRKNQGIWPRCKIGHFYRITYVSDYTIVVNAPAILLKRTYSCRQPHFLFWPDDKSTIIPNLAISKERNIEAAVNSGAVNFALGFTPHKLIVDKAEKDIIADTRELPENIQAALHTARFNGFAVKEDGKESKPDFSAVGRKRADSFVGREVDISTMFHTEKSADFYFNGQPVPCWTSVKTNSDSYTFHILDKSKATCKAMMTSGNTRSPRTVGYGRLSNRKEPAPRFPSKAELIKKLRKTQLLGKNLSYTVSKSMGDKVLPGVLRYINFLNIGSEPLEEDKKAVGLLNQYARIDKINVTKRSFIATVWNNIEGSPDKTLFGYTHTEPKAELVVQYKRTKTRQPRKLAQKKLKNRYYYKMTEKVVNRHSKLIRVIN